MNAIGSWASLIAIWGYSTYRFHAGAGMVAVLVVAWTGPSALLGTLAGTPIDRFGPRRVLVTAYLLASVIAGSMAAADTIGQLVGLTLLYGIVRSFTGPAADALPPRIVAPEDLLAANALFGVTEQLAIVLGPLAATTAIALSGVRAAFLFDALTYLVGASVVVGLRLAPHVPASPDDGGVWAGVTAIWAETHLRIVMALAAATFTLWGGYAVVEPLYVRYVIHRPTSQLGFFQVAFGVCLVGMSLVVPRLGGRVVGVRPLSLCLIASAIGAVTYVATTTVAVAYIGVMWWGASGAFFYAPTVTILQRGTSPAIHGRVLGGFRALNGAVQLVAIPVIGVIAANWGVPAAGAVMGGAAIVTGLCGVVSSRAGTPRRRTVRRPATRQFGEAA